MERVSSNDILVAGSINVAAAPPRRVDHNLLLSDDDVVTILLLSSFFSSLLIFLRFLLILLLLLANVGRRCLSRPNFKEEEEDAEDASIAPRVTIAAKAADAANDFILCFLRRKISLEGGR